MFRICRTIRLHFSLCQVKLCIGQRKYKQVYDPRIDRLNDRPSEWICARSLNSYFTFCKIVIKKRTSNAEMLWALAVMWSCAGCNQMTFQVTRNAAWIKLWIYITDMICRSRIEPSLFGEECRPDTRDRRKSSLDLHVHVQFVLWWVSSLYDSLEICIPCSW